MSPVFCFKCLLGSCIKNTPGEICSLGEWKNASGGETAEARRGRRGPSPHLPGFTAPPTMTDTSGKPQYLPQRLGTQAHTKTREWSFYTGSQSCLGGWCRRYCSVHRTLHLRCRTKRGRPRSARSSDGPWPASKVSGGPRLRTRAEREPVPHTDRSPSPQGLHLAGSFPLTSQPPRHATDERPRRPASCPLPNGARKRRDQGGGPGGRRAAWHAGSVAWLHTRRGPQIAR